MGDASGRLDRPVDVRGRTQLGATLVELIVSIVIVSVAITGVMMVISNTTRASADPLLRTQAAAIAEAYLEEILSQSLDDPGSAETGGPESGETRATYDDVSDYHGLDDDAGAVDQNGAAITGLEAYNVAVTVAAATIGGEPSKRIEVTVGHDGVPGLVVRVAAHRLN